jgi:hypothetical protein
VINYSVEKKLGKKNHKNFAGKQKEYIFATFFRKQVPARGAKFRKNNQGV